MTDRPAFDIGPMTADDLSAVVVLDRASGNNPWGLTSYVNAVLGGGDDGIYLVARREPRAERGSGVGESHAVVGFAIGSCVYDELHVMSVAVDTEWRRNGLGERLMEALMREARTRGLRHVVLEVRASNGGAQALYLKLGFGVVGHRPRFYPDTGEDALIMTLGLEDSPLP